MTASDYISTHEAVKRTGGSEHTLIEAIKNRKVEGKQGSGGNWFVRLDSLMAWQAGPSRVPPELPITPAKECAKCKRTKPVSEFPSSKRAKDGLQSWCRVCFAEYRGAKQATTEGEPMQVTIQDAKARAQSELRAIQSKIGNLEAQRAALQALIDESELAMVRREELQDAIAAMERVERFINERI